MLALKRLMMNPNPKHLSKSPFAFDHAIPQYGLLESPKKILETAGEAFEPPKESKPVPQYPRISQADPKL
jgi:hypothetical protein